MTAFGRLLSLSACILPHMPIPPPSLRDAPVAGVPPSLGRRTDAMLRGLLHMVGLFHLSMAVWIALRMGIGLDVMVPLTAGLHALLCLVCLLQHHAGRALRAATVFVIGELLLSTLAYTYWGLAAQSRLQLVVVLPILLMSAVLGRRPLGWATAWLCGLMVAGAWVDASSLMFRPDRVQLAVNDLVIAVFGTLMGAWLLHHSVTGLRESLQVARQHSAELARKRDELQVEIQEKERSREQLVHAMKMENVGRLASGIAHDFNHALALIQGYAAKARRSDDPDALQDALQGVQSATRRAATVSRRLLDFSRLDPGRPQLLDAASTVAAMAPMLQQVFDDSVQCRVATDGARSQIHFDPAQLESILLSLAVNAQQAMPEGGRFDLTLLDLPGSGELLIRVGDTGHGMSADVRAHCLEPFFTTKPMGEGTGLGLAMTASLVRAAGGEVTVESQPGAGTRIELRLPARQRATA